jgi:acetoin utilization protein AcuB
MLVAEWMTRNPVTVPVTASVGDAAALMIRHKIRRIPVVGGGDGALLGIVSKGDVLAAAPATLNPFSPGASADPALQVPLKNIMTSSPVTVASDAPLEAAAQILIEKKIGGLPVLLGARLVGILTESDLFRAFTAALGGAGAGLRISFELAPGEDVVPLVVALAAQHGQRVVSVATYVVERQAVAVVRLAGPESPGLIDQLWKTGHRVRSILRLDAVTSG